MNNKKNIALLYGGDSLEWEVSVWSGQHVALHIDKDKYCVYEILLRGNDWRVVKKDNEEREAQIDQTDFSLVWNNEKVCFDLALVMIHGTPGEDGVLQSYFESRQIPHTSSSSAVSALAFDKYACKCFLRKAGIPMADDVLLDQHASLDEHAVVNRLGLPLFVKPNCGGSSFGAAKVNRIEELRPALERAFAACPHVLAEAFIDGRELTNGILKTATQSVVLPVTEIVSKNDFFDYQAKYEGASNELTPAPISDTLRDKVQQLTSKIYDDVGCSGFIRIDYIAKGEEALFLEVNTVPGMTAMSLVPQQVRAAGMSMKHFLDLLIEDALYRRFDFAQ
jgi:D-alanine-D-alanine ligase